MNLYEIHESYRVEMTGSFKKLAEMLDKDSFDTYLRRFGFGTTTALDFPNEAAGVLLAPEHYNGTSMGSIPIGQGIAVTALQMLQAYNVLANDGVYVPPARGPATPSRRGSRAGWCPRAPRSRCARCW